MQVFVAKVRFCHIKVKIFFYFTEKAVLQDVNTEQPNDLIYHHISADKNAW